MVPPHHGGEDEVLRGDLRAPPSDHAHLQAAQGGRGRQETHDCESQVSFPCNSFKKVIF